LLLSVHEDDFFNKGNYKLFQRLGQAVSKSVTAAHLFTRAKKQDEFASLLTELNKSEFLTKPLESALDFYLGSFIDLLGAERSSVMRYDAASRELKVCAAKGYKVYPISGVPIKWGEGIAGLALKESKIFAVTKMKEAQQFDNPFTKALKRREAPEARVKSLLVLPFFEGREPLGVVNISTINYHRNFDQTDIDMARELANRMAGVIKNI
jgi:signal transduction protein with GAF and PtsI domain